MGTFTREDVLSWRGRDLVDNDGDKIGSIEDIYLDRETDEPEWAVVTTGLFGTKRTFVPISDAQPHDDGVRVPFEKATVKDAPRIDPDGELSHDEERTLYQHYGREYADYQQGSGLLDRDKATAYPNVVNNSNSHRNSNRVNSSCRDKASSNNSSTAKLAKRVKVRTNSSRHRATSSNSSLTARLAKRVRVSS